MPTEDIKPSDPLQPTVWDVAIATKDGSYAIILFLLIIVMLTRKSLGTFFTQHMEMMQGLKDSNRENSEALVKALSGIERISKNNTILTHILAKYFKMDLSDVEDKGDK